MALTIEVTYESAAGLRHEHETQLKLGGFYARIAAPLGLPPLAEATLVLAARGAPTIRLKARVTVANAESICLEIAPEQRVALAAAVNAACPKGSGGSTERSVRVLADALVGETTELVVEVVAPVEATPAPVGETTELIVELASDAQSAPPAGEEVPAEGDGASPAARARVTLGKRIAAMSVGHKLQLATQGEADVRVFLMRDRAGAVQCALLRNPRVGLDEVTALARAGHLAAETAEAIATHITFGRSHQIIMALVRNPKTPLPIAVSLVTRLQPNDLRIIAKGGVRPQVAAAARKRLVG